MPYIKNYKLFIMLWHILKNQLEVKVTDSITKCLFLTLDKFKLYPMLVINTHYKKSLKYDLLNICQLPIVKITSTYLIMKIISILLNNIDKARVLSKCKICLLSNKFLSNTIMKNILKNFYNKITGTNVIKISVINIYFPEYEILQIFITSII